MVSDWALLFIGWREIGFTISFNVSWAAFAIMFEDMLKDATVKEIEDYLEKAIQKGKQAGVSYEEIKEMLELLMEE